MVTDGSSEIGAAKLTNEVLMIMASVPNSVKNMTGVDITQQLSRGGLTGSRVRKWVCLAFKQLCQSSILLSSRSPWPLWGRTEEPTHSHCLGKPSFECVTTITTMMINVTFFRASYHFKDDDLTSKEQKYTNNDERKKNMQIWYLNGHYSITKLCICLCWCDGSPKFASWVILLSITWWFPL